MVSTKICFYLVESHRRDASTKNKFNSLKDILNQLDKIQGETHFFQD